MWPGIPVRRLCAVYVAIAPRNLTTWLRQPPLLAAHICPASPRHSSTSCKLCTCPLSLSLSSFMLAHSLRISLHESNIGAVRPDLRGRLAVVTEPKDVLAGRQTLRNLDDVLDGVTVPVHALATVAWRRERRALLVAPLNNRADLIAAGTVGAWCLWARRAVARAASHGIVAGGDPSLALQAGILWQNTKQSLRREPQSHKQRLVTCALRVNVSEGYIRVQLGA